MKVALVSSDTVFAGKLMALPFDDGVQLLTYAPFGFDSSQLTVVPDLLVFELSDDRPEYGLNAIHSIRERENFRNIPLVVISNKPTRQSIQIMHQAGVRDIITKSLEGEMLSERLQRYFHRKTPSSLHPDLSPVGAQWQDQSEASFKKLVKVEVKARLEMLPSLPNIVMEILKLAQQHNSTVSDFEDRIRQDQALTARILRMANAGFFAQKTSVKSIHDATVILGVHTLKSLVIASSTTHFFDKPALGYGYEAGGLWKHSISCALGAQFFGKYFQMDETLVDELFLHGLLHDIGKLLLTPFVSEKSLEFRQAVVEQGMSPTEAETAILGTNHCLIGLEIADRWHLPGDLKQTIEFHECPTQGGTEPSMELKLVHLSNFFCHHFKLGMHPDAFIPPPLDANLQDEFQLNPESLEQWATHWMAYLDEANKLFSLVES